MENKKRASLVLNSSSISGIHKIGMGSRHKWSFIGSLNRKGSILAGHRGSKLSVLDDITEAPKPIQVLDKAGNDVTPQLLYQEDLSDKFKQRKNVLEEIFTSMRSDHLKSSSTFNLPSASSFMGSSPSSSMRASMTKESEDSVLDSVPALPPAPWEMPRKRNNVEQQVTEEMLDEVVDAILHVTDTFTPLDIPSTSVSDDAEDAEVIEEQNIKYAELCKNRLGNDKYVVRFTQTFSEAPKNKQIQSDETEMIDEGAMATAWDIYDSFLGKAETPESEVTDFTLCTMDSSNNHEKKDEKSSSFSTIITGSTVSSGFEKESCRSSLISEPDPQVITLSESFQHSLSVMERSVTANLMHPKLAAYRQLPVLEDPDFTVEPETEEQMGEREESSSSPTLEPLWSLSCELIKGCSITCMALNHENMDLLAVGYGDFDLTQKPGFICCWSINNPTWPQRFFHCHCGVTSLDFSTKNPSQLAVGMYDGTMALYSSISGACISISTECPKKHTGSVSQVRCVKQQLGMSEEDSFERIISASMDGRITKWLFLSSSLDSMDADCEDLKDLKGLEDLKKTKQGFLSAKDPGLSFDFHPTDSNIYLVGTTEGNIYKCSISDKQQFIGTYKKHFCPVSHVEWSPFYPDVFLSCSSDWSVQLWRQDLFAPVLSFTSTQTAVKLARWSPNWSSVFAALKGDRLEIWDLNSNILNPTLVHKAAPGVRFTTFLFAKKTDCILIGDSDGQVTVYHMKNLSVGEGEKGDSLEDIVTSVVSKQL